MPSGETCVHCGSSCGSVPVMWNNLSFCCKGCEQVYRLLNENRLFKYYKIEKTPGIKIDDHSFGNKYEFLDKEEVIEKLYLFNENNIAKVRFYIPSIHCASCIWLLENINRLNSGIKHSSVNFIKKEIVISFNSTEVTLRQVVELIASIHYIPDISLHTLENQDPVKSNNKLLYKIGVAGFIFGNVMLYSLPEYFNGQPLNESLGTFLYYLSYILTVPMVFYCGSDYLISAFKNLIKGIINIDLPIAIGILSLFGVTSYEVLSGTGSGYSDSLSGFLFFLLLGKWYQSKTYQALSFDRDYKSYFPVAVTKITTDGEKNTLLEEVTKGDLLLIRNKELIPSDSVVKDGTALIDYSFVTGESTLVKKSVGDSIYAGGIQNGGAIKIEVEKEIMQSHLTQLWNQSRESEHKVKSLGNILDKVSVYFTIAVISIAISGFFWWMFNDELRTAILVLTSVLIVACPCALALSLPFTFGNVMRILGQRGLYIKNTSVIEKILKIDTIVFDKTGTITKPDENNISFIGKDLSQDNLRCAVSLARQSTHPLSTAITNGYSDIEPLETRAYVEVSGRGIYAFVGNKRVKLGSCEYVTEQAPCDKERASSVYLSINDELIGYFKLNNKYREGFEVVINSLKKDFELYLLSGDNDSEREFLEKYFDKSKVYFEQQPQDKMDFIQALQAENNNVLMTGDGLNDSGAFMKSDVALSIADDIYHFSPAGDAIIEASNFEKLPCFIRYCRKSFIVLKISFIISFLYNVIGLSFALTGNLSPVVAAILMPVSSVSVVAFATLSTRLLGKREL